MCSNSMDKIVKYFPDLTERQREQLAALLPLYEEWNAQINVISRKDMDHFYEHHVLHSLAIAKAVRKELKRRGYKVIMLRTTNKCPLSNGQRTRKANRSGADLHICIHCNAAGSSATGPLVCVPKNGRYMGKSLCKKSRRLGKLLLSSTAKAVKKKSHGTIYSNYYTTINWAKIPTVILECGFMSNPREDRQLNSKSYQKKLAKGISNGVDRYFK